MNVTEAFRSLDKGWLSVESFQVARAVSIQMYDLPLYDQNQFFQATNSPWPDFHLSKSEQWS